jgi:hypothetical protein
LNFFVFLYFFCVLCFLPFSLKRKKTNTLCRKANSKRTMATLNIPLRYAPPSLSEKDRKKQLAMIVKSRKLYSKHRFVTRAPLRSFKSKKSGHVARARRMYGLDSVTPSPALAKKTGCSVSALQQIVRKGEGAYFSSGSRPNQTPESWGLARLASAVTGGKAAAVDFAILEKGCSPKKKAFQLAEAAVREYDHGRRKTRKKRFAV